MSLKDCLQTVEISLKKSTERILDSPYDDTTQRVAHQVVSQTLSFISAPDIHNSQRHLLPFSFDFILTSPSFSKREKMREVKREEGSSGGRRGIGNKVRCVR